MNNSNLKPPTHDEAVERGRKGGKKSGEVRRERKAIKEALQLLLETKETNEQILKVMHEMGISENECSRSMSLAISVFNQALQGDVRASMFIRDTIGEKPELQVKGNQNINHNETRVTIYHVED